MQSADGSAPVRRRGRRATSAGGSLCSRDRSSTGSLSRPRRQRVLGLRESESTARVAPARALVPPLRSACAPRASRRYGACASSPCSSERKTSAAISGADRLLGQIAKDAYLALCEVFRELCRLAAPCPQRRPRQRRRGCSREGRHGRSGDVGAARADSRAGAMRNGRTSASGSARSRACSTSSSAALESPSRSRATASTMNPFGSEYVGDDGEGPAPAAEPGASASTAARGSRSARWIAASAISHLGDTRPRRLTPSSSTVRARSRVAETARAPAPEAPASRDRQRIGRDQERRSRPLRLGEQGERLGDGVPGQDGGARPAIPHEDLLGRLRVRAERLLRAIQPRLRLVEPALHHVDSRRWSRTRSARPARTATRTARGCPAPAAPARAPR